MDTIFPLDMACRASNLSEQQHIIERLHEWKVSVISSTTLSAFDRWKIGTLADKLAGQSFKEALRRGAPEKNTRDSLISMLTAYKLLELNLSTLQNDEKRLLAEIHHAWLPTYQHALQAFEPLTSTPPTVAWYQARAEIYYGKFAKVCEPFLAQLSRELSPVCLQVNTSQELELFGPQVIEDIQHHLLNRFEFLLARAIEVDANVYCVQNGIDKSHATAE